MLELRGAMTPATRQQYAGAAAGSTLSREDAWQRAVEFLFERLAVRWEIAGRRSRGLLRGCAPRRRRSWSAAAAARAPAEWFHWIRERPT